MKIKFQPIISLVFCFFLFSCANLELRKRQPTSLRFIFSSNQMLQETPCGCVLLNLGGLKSQLNHVKKALKGKKSYVVLTGTTFSPEVVSRDLKYKRAIQYAQKIRPLQPKAILLSAYDLWIPKEGIKKINQILSYTLVNSQILYQKTPLVAPFLWLEKDGRQVLFLGFSEGLPPPPFQALSIEKTLKRYQKTIQKADLVIALVDGKPDFIQSKLKSINKPFIVAGGDPFSEKYGIEQKDLHSLLLNPEGKTKKFLTLDIYWPFQAKAFFSPSTFSFYQKRKESLQTRFLNTSNPHERKEIEKELFFIKRLSQLSKKKEKTILYQYEVVFVTQE